MMDNSGSNNGGIDLNNIPIPQMGKQINTPGNIDPLSIASFMVMGGVPLQQAFHDAPAVAAEQMNANTNQQNANIGQQGANLGLYSGLVNQQILMAKMKAMQALGQGGGSAQGILSSGFFSAPEMDTLSKLFLPQQTIENDPTTGNPMVKTTVGGRVVNYAPITPQPQTMMQGGQINPSQSVAGSADSGLPPIVQVPPTDPSSPLNGLNPKQLEALRTQSDTYMNSLRDDAASILPAKRALAIMSNNLSQFQSGFGANTKAEIASIGNSLLGPGVGDSILGTNAAAVEAANSQAPSLVKDSLKGVRASEPIINYFQQANPGPDKEPAANAEIINNTNRMLDERPEKLRAALTYKQMYGVVDPGFDAKWNSYINDPVAYKTGNWQPYITGQPQPAAMARGQAAQGGNQTQPQMVPQQIPQQSIPTVTPQVNLAPSQSLVQNSPQAFSLETLKAERKRRNAMKGAANA